MSPLVDGALTVADGLLSEEPPLLRTVVIPDVVADPLFMVEEPIPPSPVEPREPKYLPLLALWMFPFPIEPCPGLGL